MKLTNLGVAALSDLKGRMGRPENMRTLAIIIVYLISWPALGMDMTTGSMACSTWLEARAKLKSWVQPHARDLSEKMPTDHVAGDAWLIGFIEGYSFSGVYACPSKKRLGDGLDTGAVFDIASSICISKGGDTPLLIVAAEMVSPNTGIFVTPALCSK